MDKRENEVLSNEALSNEVIVDSKDHSCCGGNGKQINMKKHLLHMVLCCGLPMVIIFLLPFIAKVNPWVAGGLGIIAPFICPLIMGGMLFMLFRKSK